jgi:hypothetical protein
MSKTEWAEVGNLVCGILHEVYVARPAAYGAQATRRGITMDHLASVAVAAAMHDRLRTAAQRPGGIPRHAGEKPGTNGQPTPPEAA